MCRYLQRRGGWREIESIWWLQRILSPWLCSWRQKRIYWLLTSESYITVKRGQDIKKKRKKRERDHKPTQDEEKTQQGKLALSQGRREICTAGFLIKHSFKSSKQRQPSSFLNSHISPGLNSSTDQLIPSFVRQLLPCCWKISCFCSNTC